MIRVPIVVASIYRWVSSKSRNDNCCECKRNKTKIGTSHFDYLFIQSFFLSFVLEGQQQQMMLIPPQFLTTSKDFSLLSRLQTKALAQKIIIRASCGFALM
jgi:hypothetical protein